MNEGYDFSWHFHCTKCQKISLYRAVESWIWLTYWMHEIPLVLFETISHYFFECKIACSISITKWRDITFEIILRIYLHVTHRLSHSLMGRCAQNAMWIVPSLCGMHIKGIKFMTYIHVHGNTLKDTGSCCPNGILKFLRRWKSFFKCSRLMTF